MATTASTNAASTLGHPPPRVARIIAPLPASPARRLQDPSEVRQRRSRVNWRSVQTVLINEIARQTLAPHGIEGGQGAQHDDTVADGQPDLRAGRRSALHWPA
jgi:hypothetical protein